MRKLANEELNRKSINEFRESPKTPFVVVLDNVRSLNNIGSVFRTADAFLIESVFLCGITGTPPHREINKTALGATESVSWKYFSETADAVRSLREEGYVVVSVEQEEGYVSLADYMPCNDSKYALVFGHEINGVAQEVVGLSDSCIEIPQFGTKHSFNISVSVGIVLWDLCGKLQNS